MLTPVNPPTQLNRQRSGRPGELHAFLLEVKAETLRAGEVVWYKYPELISASKTGLNHASSRASDVRNEAFHDLRGFNADWDRTDPDSELGYNYFQYTGLYHGPKDRTPSRMTWAPKGFDYVGDPAPELHNGKQRRRRGNDRGEGR
jgi:hypothetical protein